MELDGWFFFSIRCETKKEKCEQRVGHLTKAATAATDF